MDEQMHEIDKDKEKTEEKIGEEEELLKTLKMKVNRVPLNLNRSSVAGTDLQRALWALIDSFMLILQNV